MEDAESGIYVCVPGTPVCCMTVQVCTGTYVHTCMSCVCMCTPTYTILIPVPVFCMSAHIILCTFTLHLVLCAVCLLQVGPYLSSSRPLTVDTRYASPLSSMNVRPLSSVLSLVFDADGLLLSRSSSFLTLPPRRVSGLVLP